MSKRYRHVVLLSALLVAISGCGEAERERRAKIINAMGGFQFAEKMGNAAKVLNTYPRVHLS
jgi:hypothetical protein